MGRPGIAAVRRRRRRAHGGGPVFTGGNKRGKGHRMVPFPPLDSPKPSFEPLSKAFAAKRGETRARFRASGRFWDAVMP